jgi:hypothetical protein
MKVPLSNFHAVIRQFSPVSSQDENPEAARVARAVIATTIAGLSAVRQLAKIRSQVVIEKAGQNVMCDVKDPAVFLSAVEGIADLPVEVPDDLGGFRIAEDQFYVKAGDNELGLPLEDLACQGEGCGKVPAADDNVWFLPTGGNQYSTLCEACAEKVVAPDASTNDASE